MKKLLIAAWIAASSATVWASCTSHTYIIDGKYVVCNTCCYSGNCTTTCF